MIRKYLTIYTELLDSFRKNGRILLRSLMANMIRVMLNGCASDVVTELNRKCELLRDFGKYENA
jgi:hypothetical protein